MFTLACTGDQALGAEGSQIATGVSHWINTSVFLVTGPGPPPKDLPAAIFGVHWFRRGCTAWIPIRTHYSNNFVSCRSSRLHNGSRTVLLLPKVMLGVKCCTASVNVCVCVPQT